MMKRFHPHLTIEENLFQTPGSIVFIALKGAERCWLSKLDIDIVNIA
jgi:hypothetical protein